MTEIGLIADPNKPKIAGLIDTCLGLLEDRSLSGLLAEELRAVSKCGKHFCTDEELRSRADLIVAFGGDGPEKCKAPLQGGQSC